MEMGINSHGAWPSRRSELPEGEACLPEWRGLHARLAAGYAARQALAVAARVAPPAWTTGAASFDSASARALGAYPDEYAAVNPTASSDVKPVAGIAGGVAGAPIAGGRGPR